MRPFLFVEGSSLRLLWLRRIHGSCRLRGRRRSAGVRIVAKAIRRAEYTAIGASRLRAILQRLRSKSLQQRLIGRSDESVAGLGRGIVHKLPLVVFLLFVELANRGLLADAGHPHDRPAPDWLLARGLIAD